MGYYTTFNIQSDDSFIEDHMERISEISGYYCFNDAIKWYDCEKDMRSYSKQYPDVLFSVYYDGEEQGDVGVKYFKNGKMQEEKTTFIFGKFDETKLK